MQKMSEPSRCECFATYGYNVVKCAYCKAIEQLARDAVPIMELLLQIHDPHNRETTDWPSRYEKLGVK